MPLRWNAAQALEAFIDPKTYLFFLFGFTANVPNVTSTLHPRVPPVLTISSGRYFELVIFSLLTVAQYRH